MQLDIMLWSCITTFCTISCKENIEEKKIVRVGLKRPPERYKFIHGLYETSNSKMQI